MNRLDEIETYIAIARAGSISEAARRLGIAKSAASRRLSELEARLGVQLVVRSTRQLTLTEAGAAFLERAERVLDELAEAEAEARAELSVLTGKLRLAAPLSFGLSRLAPLLADFMAAHPDIVVEADFSDRHVDLIREGFDLAIRIGALSDSSLIARKIAEVRQIVAASPDFWDQHGRPEHPDQLADLPCLRYLNPQGTGTISFSAPSGKTGSFVPSHRMLASNGDVNAMMASRGLGYLIEPDFIVEPLLANGRA